MTEPLPTRADWIAALRSGEYKQATGKLRRDDGFCCLGVAAVLCGIDPAALEGTGTEILHPCFSLLGSDPQPWHISEAQVKSLCLTREIQSNAARMNDNRYSFTEIADWLESL